MVDINTTKAYSEEMTKELDIYKYTTEGPNRTYGSYVLTHFKSLFGYLDKDPGMFDVMNEMNSKIGDIRYNEGYNVGLTTGIKYGVITSVVIAGAGFVTYKLVKRSKQNKTITNKEM